MALRKLLWRKYLFIGRTEGETEQGYWNGKRKKHLAREHTEGIVDGVEVTETSPPSLSVQVGAGRAVDNLGNDPEVESVQELDLASLIPGSGTVTVYVTLAYTETEVEPYFVDETGDYQNKYIQDGSLVEVTTVPPMDPVLELARVELAAGAAQITDAVDPQNPQPNEIDLRYRKRSGMVSLALSDLSDVSPDEAAAFNNMNAPSISNPVATVQDVADGVAPVSAEVLAARGSQPSLDGRLDVSLDEAGSIKTTAPPYPEVIAARGSRASLDERLDVSLNEDGSLKPPALGDLSDVSAEEAAAFNAMNSPSALRHLLVGSDDAQAALDSGDSPSAANPFATVSASIHQAQASGVVAADGILTLTHDFGVIPTVTVLKKVAGDWVDGLASGSLIRVDATIARIKNLAAGPVEYLIVATV